MMVDDGRGLAWRNHNKYAHTHTQAHIRDRDSTHTHTQTETAHIHTDRQTPAAHMLLSRRMCEKYQRWPQAKTCECRM